ncbi:MAG TPA: CcmD family protein [Vicinamibacterales bacterium]|nr:CcmD family protein [Vicinamibacterales bacterium]
MRYLGAIVLAFTVLLTAAAAAQPQPPPKPAAQDEFVPVNAPMNAQDTIPAPLLVGSAYAFIWIVVFAYVWSIRSRLASVERDMAALDRRLGPGSR